MKYLAPLAPPLIRRFGDCYEGNDQPKWKRERRSIVWAEISTALDQRKPVACFVREKTSDDRNTFNTLLEKLKSDGRSDGTRTEEVLREGRAGWVEDTKIFSLLDYLQLEQGAETREFRDLPHLKDRVGRWLDELAQRVAYALHVRSNAGIVSAGSLVSLLGELYSVHNGEIWLINNDLELIRSRYLFDRIYKGVLRERLADEKISKLLLFLAPDKLTELTAGGHVEQAQLVNQFAAMGNTLKRIEVVPLPKGPPEFAHNLSLYTVDGDIAHPDTVCLLRYKEAPFAATHGEVGPDDLLVICHQQRVPSFFVRTKQMILDYRLMQLERKRSFCRVLSAASAAANSSATQTTCSMTRPTQPFDVIGWNPSHSRAKEVVRFYGSTRKDLPHRSGLGQRVRHQQPPGWRVPSRTHRIILSVYRCA